MKRIRRRSLAGAVATAAAGLALVALAPPALADSTQTVPIELTEWALELPAGLKVHAGETVKFQLHNHGTMFHSLAVSGSGVNQAVPQKDWLAAGADGTFEFTFPQSGTYTLFCPVAGHKQAGMTASLTVDAQAATPPAASPAANSSQPAAPSGLPKTGDGSAASSSVASKTLWGIVALVAAVAAALGLKAARRAQ